MDLPVDAQTVVVFDLDDTLYAERDYVHSGLGAVAAMLADQGHGDLTAELARLFGDRQPIFDTLAARHGWDNILRDAMLRCYRQHLPVIEATPGARALLESIKQAGGRLALVTDGRGPTQRQKLQALGLADLFDVLVISEETGHAKPDPFNFELVRQRLPGAHYTYVGDNLLKDFVAPRRLGWRCICLADSGGRNIHPQSRAPRSAWEGLVVVEALASIRVVRA